MHHNDPMRLTCSTCHKLTVDPDVRGDCLVCSSCGAGREFKRLPVYHFMGACGSGKSTVLDIMRRRGVSDRVLVDTELFFNLREDWKTPADEFAAFKSFCLSVAFDIGQAGLPVMLMGATRPVSNERLPERKYFAETKYLALVADDADIERRLCARGWFPEQLIRFEVAYNGWLRDEGPKDSPPVEIIDSSSQSAEETADDVMRWLAR